MAFEAEYYFDELETVSDGGGYRKRRIMPMAFRASIRDPQQEITLSIGRDPNKAIASKKGGSLDLEMIDADGIEDRVVRRQKPRPLLRARVENPAETSAFKDLVAQKAAGMHVYMHPLYREVDGGYTDLPEPGNPGVKIRQYDSVVLYGLKLSIRGKKGQIPTGGRLPSMKEERGSLMGSSGVLARLERERGPWMKLPHSRKQMRFFRMAGRQIMVELRDEMGNTRVSSLWSPGGQGAIATGDQQTFMLALLDFRSKSGLETASRTGGSVRAKVLEILAMG